VASGSMMSAVKGMALGLASGMVAGYVGKKMLDDGKRGIKRKANKAIDTMENITSTAKYIFR